MCSHVCSRACTLLVSPRSPRLARIARLARLASLASPASLASLASLASPASPASHLFALTHKQAHNHARQRSWAKHAANYTRHRLKTLTGTWAFILAAGLGFLLEVPHRRTLPMPPSLVKCENICTPRQNIFKTKLAVGTQQSHIARDEEFPVFFFSFFWRNRPTNHTTNRMHRNR